MFTKNNYLILCIFILFNILISNTCLAKDKQYHKLQVELTTIEQSTESQAVLEAIKQDILIVTAVSEPKITQHRIENLHHRTPKEIIENLQGLGYYQAKIIDNSLSNIQQNSWLASYKISLGKPTLIQQVVLNISGDAKNNSDLVKNINKISNKLLIVNKKLVHDNYEKAKQLILNQMHDYGFLAAKFVTSNMVVDVANNTAIVTLDINSKQQHYFGPVIFESDVYGEDFLKKYIPFKENDPYSAFQLANLKNNLLNSGLFNKIRIDPQKQSAANIPIKVRVYTKPANHYNAGAGYGTDTGIRGNVGYTRRRKSHPGHEVNLKLSASKIRKQILVNYGLLGRNPMVDRYSFGILGQDVQVKERIHKNLEFFGQKSKKYTNREQLFRLSFLTETFKELPASEKKQAHFLMPSIHLSWTHPRYLAISNESEKEPEDDTSIIFGNKVNLIAKFASKATASSANLVQLNLKEKWIAPLIYDFRLILKANAATTMVSKFDKLPHSLRFFAGGDNSVRGFAYNSLGPSSVDTAGNKGVIGGRHLLTAGLEIEKPIPGYDSLVAASFLDAGNAFNNFHFEQLAMGAGVGMGYRTPIGSVKAYIAKPIRHLSFEDARKKKVRFHLTFGADL